MIKKIKLYLFITLPLTLIFSTLVGLGGTKAAGPAWPTVTAMMTQFAPAQEEVVLQDPPDLRWPAVTGANVYNFQLARDIDLDNVFSGSCSSCYNMYTFSGDSNFFNFPNQIGRGVWYWRVRYATSWDGEWSEWSDVRRFRIDLDRAVDFPVPSLATLKSRFSAATGVATNNYPRVWADPATLSTFRGLQGIDGLGKDVYPAIKQNVADRRGNMPPANPSEVNQSLIDEVNYMTDAAFVYLVEGSTNRGGTAAGDLAGVDAVNRLMIIADWPQSGVTWFDNEYGPTSQLHRYIMYNAAMAYDWLYPAMSVAQRHKVADMILARLDSLADFMWNTTKIYNRPYDSHGWSNSALVALTATIMLKEYSYDSAKSAKMNTWFDRYVPFFINFLSPWGGDDGGWGGGTGYWRWGVADGVDSYAMDVIKDMMNLDLYQKASVINRKYFPLYFYPNSAPRGAFGDGNADLPNYSAPSYSNANFYRRYAGIYNDPIMQWSYNDLISRGKNPYISRSNYITGSTSTTTTPPSNLPKAKWYKDIGWVSMNSNLAATQALNNNISLYFRSSFYGGIHNRADQNAFMINAFGKTLALDSGYYDSYGSDHHANFTQQTFAHNAITYGALSGGTTWKGQNKEDMGAKGKIVGFATLPDIDVTTGDALAAYSALAGNTLEKARRSVIYVRPAGVFITVDKLASTTDTNFSYWLHSETNPAFDSDNLGLNYINAPAAMKVDIVYPRSGITKYNSNNFVGADGLTHNPVPPAGESYASQWHTSFTTASSKAATIIATLKVYQYGSSPATITETDNSANGYMKLSISDGTTVYVRTSNTDDFYVNVANTYRFEGDALVIKGDTYTLVNGHIFEKGDGTGTNWKTWFYRFDKASPVTIAYDNSGGRLEITVPDDATTLDATPTVDAGINIYVPWLVDVTKLYNEESKVSIDKNGSGAADKGVTWSFNSTTDLLTLNLQKGYHSLGINNSH